MKTDCGDVAHGVAPWRRALADTGRDIAPLWRGWRIATRQWEARLKAARLDRWTPIMLSVAGNELLCLWIFEWFNFGEMTGVYAVDAFAFVRPLFGYMAGAIIAMSLVQGIRIGVRGGIVYLPKSLRWVVLGASAALQLRYNWIVSAAKGGTELVPATDRDRVAWALESIGGVIAVWPTVWLAVLTMVGLVLRLRVVGQGVDLETISANSLLHPDDVEPVPRLRETFGDLLRRRRKTDSS